MKNIDYLTEFLLEENSRVKLTVNPVNDEEKFQLYRSLVNIREAKTIPDEYIHKENEFLQEYIENTKKIVSVNDLDIISTKYPQSKLVNSDKLSLWQGDITSLEIGAIVNAANSQGLGCFIPGHNCIDNQIHTFAGVLLRLACDEYMKTIDYNLETGKAFTTGGYNLPASNVIHTVGPIISNNVEEIHQKQLANCYINCLDEAKKNNIRTIAFCSISTGVFRFPKQLASKIALKTVDKYLTDNNEYFEKVVFNVYSDEDVEIYEQSIREY